MRNLVIKRRKDFLTGALLALLLFGAYIPVGFMPAAGTPFLLELCPVAAPLPMSAHDDVAMDASMPMAMPMAAHHHPADTSHGGSHSHFQSCPFGSAPGAGPLTHLIFFSPPAPVSASDIIPASPPLAGRLPRAHPARGPPSPI